MDEERGRILSDGVELWLIHNNISVVNHQEGTTFSRSLSEVIAIASDNNNIYIATSSAGSFDREIEVLQLSDGHIIGRVAEEAAAATLPSELPQYSVEDNLDWQSPVAYVYQMSSSSIVPHSPAASAVAWSVLGCSLALLLAMLVFIQIKKFRTKRQ
ncbi:MAG: hypothetical protein ACIAS6_03470 [Phycisphaerales bacterium JB060]